MFQLPTAMLFIVAAAMGAALSFTITKKRRKPGRVCR
jgi:hypothetical protein